jgi:hypothetical protein
MSVEKNTVSKNDLSSLIIVSIITVAYFFLLVGSFVMGPLQPFIWLFCWAYDIELNSRDFSGFSCVLFSVMSMMFSMQMFISFLILSDNRQKRLQQQDEEASKAQKLVKVD